MRIGAKVNGGVACMSALGMGACTKVVIEFTILTNASGLDGPSSPVAATVSSNITFYKPDERGEKSGYMSTYTRVIYSMAVHHASTKTNKQTNKTCTTHNSPFHINPTISIRYRKIIHHIRLFPPRNQFPAPRTGINIPPPTKEWLHIRS